MSEYLKVKDIRICACGCEDFNVFHTEDETKVLLRCCRCSSVRRVISPGVGVKKYDFSIPLKVVCT